ncbi:MAG: RNA 2',3'-cyclic phosphodiesterase [Gammaproteobacteria bacterium]|nr:RNA 2',3'-cyclic phosphodiesterase [Gammaproteobacteria bacterium]
MARVFFALLPDAPSSARLLRLQEQYLSGTGPWRLLPVESLHLTLAFIGERDDDWIEALVEAAAAISLAAMTQPSSGWLWLPSVERPRVLALGVTADDVLRGLADQVWQLLDEVDWERPGRPLLPHVSLARMGSGRALPALAAAPVVELGWARLGLFASHLTGAGPQYQELWSVASGQSSGQT